jgi:parallel beta helix pectate lyase-like protein
MGRTAGYRLCISFAAASLIALLTSGLASAHIERASYWPDPAPDCSVSPCAGGEVPTARSLASAVSSGSAANVVCQRDSVRLAQRSIQDAQSTGYILRPTLPRQKISSSEGKALLDLNKKLFQRCHYRSIQDAVNESGNNGRVVIMPGLYTEPESRAAPTHDPACTQYGITNDRGETGALSYKWQYYCPNDQNLIAVLGRAPGTTDPPNPPAEDRHGIPDLGPCIRCNLQIEGSGVGPDDVIIDAGRVQSGDGAPIDPAKDVGIRADRADGIVIRNVKVRHATEHDIYVLEADGYLLDRFKTFYGGEYGVLTFVEDHGLMQNCEAAGNGDSGLYPGAGADTGNQRDTSIYPQFRYSQEIRNCDSHHNASGYSGTDGNATRVNYNNFYDNALGFTTDVFTAPGHPGFPQDSDLIEHNNFYSNNFNPYVAGSDVVPTVPVPVGTGLWIAGGNDNVVRNNYFYDNWRRGTMVFAVPDQVVCGPAGIDPTLLAGCNPTAVPPSTSYRNRFVNNLMGRSPSGQVLPNGTGDVTTGRTDFWWDQYLGNTGNCWRGNIGKNGKADGVTSTPPMPLLPSACDSSSIGTVGPQQEPELLNCLADIEFDTSSCPWFTTPSKP